MAITPRSFLLNPTLLFVISAAAIGSGALLFHDASPRYPAQLSYWESVRESCEVSEADPAVWLESTWHAHVHCFLDAERFTDAYAAANESLHHFPKSETLLNLRGYAAARNGDHAVAGFDFREGLRLTGSPSGIFENNLAWTMLWQLEGVPAHRQSRVLLEARALYRQSLQKGVSCERLHTGMFVEYAIGAHAAATEPAQRRSATARDAVQHYVQLWNQYQPCWHRIDSGDAMVVEEILSAAAMDQQMGLVAGVDQPTRHLPWSHRAIVRAKQLEVTVDAAYCDDINPVPGASSACKEMLDR